MQNPAGFTTHNCTPYFDIQTATFLCLLHTLCHM